jgi:hypothetical protein
MHKLRRMTWTGHVASMDMRNAFYNLAESLNREVHPEAMDVDNRILKWVLRK